MPNGVPTFIHLNIKSSYSLLEGMMSVKDIAQKAKELAMPAVGVTDLNNLFGAVQLNKHLPSAGVQPIFGVSLGLARTPAKGATVRPTPDAITLLVQNAKGWGNLIQLASKAYLDPPPDAPPQITLSDLAQYHEGLILLTGDARHGRVARYVQEGRLEKAEAFLNELNAFMPTRVYVELQRHDLHEEKLVEADVVALAYKLDLPLVATNDVRFLTPEHTKAHEVLMSIGTGTTIATPERPQLSPEHYFKTPEEMCALFQDLPEATENTVVIAQRCAFKIPVGTNYMPEWEDQKDPRPVPNILKEETEKGLRERLAPFFLEEKMPKDEKAALEKKYQERLDYELGVIGRMGFDGYFLIVSDFCKWSLENGIPVGPGRGSGAGSLVAYALKITNVDPIQHHLLFERFLNPDRVSLPDFDIDFCQERREEVIDYVRQKYGDARVAQIITFGTLKARACIRDVGRVLQMPFGQVSQICAFVPEGPKATSIQQTMKDDERLEEMYNTDDDVKVLLDIAMQLEGAFRHCSTHAAGVIIAPKAMTTYCPLYRDPRAPLPATQFSMNDAEASGLVKFDFLGLKTLTVVQKSLENIEKSCGEKLNADLFPLDDPASYELLKSGHTIGIFQVEGSGMQSLMRDARPDRFEDLVALIALYRPGPMENIPSFVARKHKEEKIESIHPSFDHFLTETYGIIVYQEQVMQCAQQFAGYSLGGADILRRAMGKKKPEEMAKQRKIFVKGAVENQGVSQDFANNIFDTIDKFAGYGFNKSHALAYALVSYQTLYLKTHYPKEFMAASMTLDRGNTDKLFKFKQDLERMKIPLLRPHINKSRLDFSVEGEGIRFALGAIKGAGTEAMAFIQEERNAHGAYKNVMDFMARMSPQFINRRQLEALIKAGAFDPFEENRHMLLKAVGTLLGYMQSSFEEKESTQIGLFGGADTQQTLAPPPLPWAPVFDTLEQLSHELQAVGFYLSAHPLDAFGEELEQHKNLHTTLDIPPLVAKGIKEARIPGIILSKREMRTKSGKRMAFLTLSDQAGYQEALLFPEAYERLALMLDEEGPFIFQLNMEKDKQNDELRVMIEGISKLDQGLRSGQHLQLYVPSTTLVPALKSALTTQPEGKTQTEIVIPTPGIGHVVIRLKERFEMNRKLRLKLENIKGIRTQTIEAAEAAPIPVIAQTY